MRGSVLLGKRSYDGLVFIDGVITSSVGVRSCAKRDRCSVKGKLDGVVFITATFRPLKNVVIRRFIAVYKGCLSLRRQGVR